MKHPIQTEGREEFERARRDLRERVARRRHEDFAFGVLLLRCRDQRLYRSSFPTFGAFAASLGMSAREARNRCRVARRFSRADQLRVGFEKLSALLRLGTGKKHELLARRLLRDAERLTRAQMAREIMSALGIETAFVSLVGTDAKALRRLARSRGTSIAETVRELIRGAKG